MVEEEEEEVSGDKETTKQLPTRKERFFLSFSLSLRCYKNGFDLRVSKEEEEEPLTPFCSVNLSLSRQPGS